ncbi:MAG: hypothetical protein ABJH26_09335 [Marinomonas sp.]
MIIVIEGISAAGKTTYSRKIGMRYCVPEIPAKGERPGEDGSLQEHALFWANHNAARFQMAMEIEAQYGFAICDTDPMKVHYSWSMERAGFHWPDKFESAIPAVRQAIQERRLGFADRYYVKRIDAKTARMQKEGDLARSRGNFDQHLALQPHLIDWFRALTDILPRKVEFAFPDPANLLSQLESKTPEDNPRRFDTSIFDALIERLPT